MRTKPADVHYCGVDSSKIMTAKPIIDNDSAGHMFTWIAERYRIHIKKDILALPPPWTTYEPLKNSRFTNVRREHDRESKWLINRISTNNDLSLQEKILNSILFRTWNKSETFALLGGPFKKASLLSEELVGYWRSAVAAYSNRHPLYTWYTNAFNCGGLKAAWGFPAFDIYECTDSAAVVKMYQGGEYFDLPLKKAKHYLREHPHTEVREIVGRNKPRVDYPVFEACIPARMYWLVRHVIDMDLPTKLLECTNQKDAFETLKQVRGFSDFLAYQVFVDLTYIPEFPFSENEFTVAGPGCRRGIDLLFKDRDGLSYEEAIFWVRDHQDQFWKTFKIDPVNLFVDIPEKERSLNVMSLENIFCEHSKHTRLLQGGKARVGYRVQPKGFF